jgi:predicted 2-oxoglutarate/Fe(II)-dependent dioxygenase YbiX
VQEYARPIAAMLFPDTLRHSDTTESFVFTIRYKAGEDVSLAEHRDASVATLNLNLNVDINEASNENWSARQGSESVDQYSGSELQFVDEDDPSVHHTVRFEPGMAILHKGSLRHAAKPIETGERQNLIIWLFGDDGQVRIAPYETSEQMSVAERWSSDVVTDSCRAQPNVY